MERRARPPPLPQAYLIELQFELARFHRFFPRRECFFQTLFGVMARLRDAAQLGFEVGQPFRNSRVLFGQASCTNGGNEIAATREPAAFAQRLDSILQ